MDDTYSTLYLQLTFIPLGGLQAAATPRDSSGWCHTRLSGGRLRWIWEEAGSFVHIALRLHTRRSQEELAQIYFIYTVEAHRRCLHRMCTHTFLTVTAPSLATS